MYADIGITGPDDSRQSRDVVRDARLRVLEIVEGSNDAGHELDASPLGIAEETLLAGNVPIQPPASVPPTAVRAGEGEVVKLLRHLGSLSATPARWCS